MLEGIGSRTYVVLGHPDFAGEVSLTSAQAQLIRTIEARPLTEQEKAAFPLDPTVHPDMPEEVERAIGNAIDIALADILTPKQYRRFMEVMLQVYGPEMALIYDSTASELMLSSEQVSAMTKLMKGYEDIRRPLTQALGRYVMAGYTGLDDLGDGDDEEAKARKLVRRIDALARRMDHELLDAMTKEQRLRWQGLLGQPIRWRWPEHAISAYGIDWSDSAVHGP